MVLLFWQAFFASVVSPHLLSLSCVAIGPASFSISVLSLCQKAISRQFEQLTARLVHHRAHRSFTCLVLNIQSCDIKGTSDFRFVDAKTDLRAERAISQPLVRKEHKHRRPSRGHRQQKPCYYLDSLPNQSEAFKPHTSNHQRLLNFYQRLSL